MPSSSKSLFSHQSRKILIVDDDRMNIRILQGILTREGYVLHSASTGEEALEIYDSFEPDLVLLDVLMPGINGFETCRRLHEKYGDETAPVIFITAKSESDDVVEGLSAGGVDYLPKPFRAKEALARIHNHMQTRVLLEEQKRLVEQLSEANAAKNRFLGMAAHDLRNPLASIRGLAEFLRDDKVAPLPPDQLDLIETIYAASQQMLTLVNELLDVATIEAGELKLNTEQSNLVDLLNRSITLASLDGTIKKTTIELTESPESLILNLDASKIRQVIDNLLSNAIKYSPPGSHIRVYCAVENEECKVSVRDQGPGIPENEMALLFKDFSRLSTKPTAGEKSTGLGLAICRKIMESHNGKIQARNHPEGGCIFSFHLPLPH